MDKSLKEGISYVSGNKSFFAYPLPMRSAEEVVAETIVACFLTVFGLVGNGVVCYTIHRSRYTKSSMYYFMVHLAYADLLVSCVSVPLTLLSSRPQPFLTSIGPVPCKLIRFIQYILPPASVAILAATSVDRYYSICHPLRFVMTTRRTHFIAAGCWIFAILLTLPIFYLIESRDVMYKNRVCLYCAIKETSTHPSTGQLYSIFRGTVGFVFPLTVIVVMYYRVLRTVWLRNSKQRSFSVVHNQKLNVVKTLLMVVIAFNLSWAPFSITNKYYLGVNNIKREEIITFWIGLSASVYNPLIYAFYNKNFRKALKEVFLKKSSRRGKENDVLTPAKFRDSILTIVDFKPGLANLNSIPSEPSGGFRSHVRAYDCKAARDRAEKDALANQATYREDNRSDRRHGTIYEAAASVKNRLKAKKICDFKTCGKDECSNNCNKTTDETAATNIDSLGVQQNFARNLSKNLTPAQNLPQIDS